MSHHGVAPAQGYIAGLKAKLPGHIPTNGRGDHQSAFLVYEYALVQELVQLVVKSLQGLVAGNEGS